MVGSSEGHGMEVHPKDRERALGARWSRQDRERRTQPRPCFQQGRKGRPTPKLVLPSPQTQMPALTQMNMHSSPPPNTGINKQNDVCASNEAEVCPAMPDRSSRQQKKPHTLRVVPTPGLSDDCDQRSQVECALPLG